MATDRERFLIRNTLLSLLKAVEGKETTIELRNENSVSGKVHRIRNFEEDFLQLLQKIRCKLHVMYLVFVY